MALTIADEEILWNLCDSYEKVAGSRAALNNFLTMLFRQGANVSHVITELRRSIKELKSRN